MTIINGVMFPHDSFTREKIDKILKEKGHFYKCRVCRRKFVEKEGELCERCRHFAELEYKEE